MSGSGPRDPNRSGIITVGEVIPILLIIGGLTLLLALSA
ncbi:hypothetical protein AFFFEF_00393 [Methylorubrum extorquens]